MNITPQDRLKWVVLSEYNKLYANYDHIVEEYGSIDELYDAISDENYMLEDMMSELRCSGVETNITAPYSRYYESISVAAICPDGKWVGWTYWYGGWSAEEIDWIEESYNLDCEEKEVLQTVRTFTKIAKE